MAASKYPDPPERLEQPYPMPMDEFAVGPTFSKCSGHVAHNNCSTNRDSTCAGNECAWYGDPCPTHGPFLLDGQRFDCTTFDDPDVLIPGIISYATPNVGVVASAVQLNALRDSILDEYSNRRWILDSTNRQNVVDFEALLGEIINAPNIDVLGDFIQFIIDRGEVPYQSYNFADDLAYVNIPTGFQDTDHHTISTPPNTGDIIAASDIRELMGIVDDLRKACVCNNNCVCFGNCDCNWNCYCNYGS